MLRGLALSISLVLFGCASDGGGDGGAIAATGPPTVLGGGAKIGRIQVSADPSFNDDQRTVIEQYDALGRLESEITLALQRRDAHDPSGALTLEVVLDGFRLRSNAASVWLGSMAGADSLATSVSVKRGDEVLRTFHTDTSSVMGGLIMPGRTKRLNRLVLELAKRIADGV